jgi:hypothetical protein
MNRKQFGILLVLLVILGGGGWYIQQGRNRFASAGEQGTGQKLMGESFPINDIAHLHIVQGSNEVNLIRKQDVWKVAERKDFPANFAAISDFLIKLRDIKVVQQDEVGDTDKRRLQLLATGDGTNLGMFLDFKNADEKTLSTLVLGKKHLAKPNEQQLQYGMGDAGFADGRYVQSAANQKVVMLISDPLNSIEPKPADWLNKDFFKVERPKFISVSRQVASNSWAITRETESGEWTLVGAVGEEKLDSARASGVSNPFASPSFNDIARNGADDTQLGLDKPVIIQIETFDDFSYTIKLGAKKDDQYPMVMTINSNYPKERTPSKDEKPEDKTKADKAWADRRKQLESQLANTKRYENWVFMVPAWTVDTLLKDRKELLVEKKDEPKSPENTNTPKPEPFPANEPVK